MVLPINFTMGRRSSSAPVSYEARKFGVRSAMPSITAKRLCPDGCFVRPRMDAYREESHQIMQIIASTGAIVEQMSVDEAYLDISSSRNSPTNRATKLPQLSAAKCSTACTRSSL